MKKRYLVTGGTGFIGSAIVQKLIHSNNKVVVLDNNYRGSLDRFGRDKSKFKFIKGDIRNPKTVTRAAEGVDSILHLAYINGTEHFYTIPEVILEVGVKGMVNVLDACRAHNIKELFLMSSSETYATPPVIPTPENVPLVIPDTSNPRYSYSGGKIISELMTLNYGRKYLKRSVVVRPHNVYGPNMGYEHVIPQLILRMSKLPKKKNKNLPFPIQGTGEETRTFIYIDDFIDGFMLLLKKSKHMETYHIGSMKEAKVKSLAAEIADILGVSIAIKPGKLQKGSPMRRCPNIKKLLGLGFKPKVSLSQGLIPTVQWYLENPKFTK